MITTRGTGSATMARMARLDKRGRRIGHNWWREFVWDQWHGANQHWLDLCLEACNGHRTEESEFRENHPQPTFKAYLLMNKGMGSNATETAA